MRINNNVRGILNFNKKRMTYSLKYSLLFSILSALIVASLIPVSAAKGWDFLWIYFGITTFLIANTLFSFFIERKGKFNNTRIIIIAIILVPLSHWLFWYGFLVINYIEGIFFNHQMDKITNPINGIIGASVYSSVSLIFIAWIQIPISIALSLFFKNKKVSNEKIDGLLKNNINIKQ
jgi:hypothetical protein